MYVKLWPSISSMLSLKFHKVLPVSPESTPSPGSSLPHRRKPRVHRVGQAKVKRRRESTPSSPGRPKREF
jgi:hypothetical protein